MKLASLASCSNETCKNIKNLIQFFLSFLSDKKRNIIQTERENRVFSNQKKFFQKVLTNEKLYDKIAIAHKESKLLKTEGNRL